MKLTNQIKAYYPINDQEINDQRIMLDWLEQNPNNALLRSNEIAHFTASAIIMNQSFTKVCMVYHNIYQTYCWVGGHHDGDEDAIAVALKEASEETGITNFQLFEEGLSSIEILPVFAHYKKGKYISGHLHMNTSILLVADEEELLQVKEDENSDVKWIKVEQLEQYSNEPELIVIYKKLIQRTIERNKR